MNQQRVKIGIVFLIVFVDLVGFGIVIPILPLYGEELGPSPMVLGLLMASFSIMQFLFSPILGRLSDRVGRRPVLLVSLLGSVVGYVLFGIGGSLTILFASRIIDGISGGNISTAQAVIADITTEEDRARGMGLIGAAFGLGFILGPAIGAVLVQIGPWAPGAAAAATSLIAFGLVYFKLPETFDPTVAVVARRRTLNLASLIKALSHPLVGFCLVIVFCVIFAFSNFEVTFAQFVKFQFELDISKISLLFVFAGVMGALVQGGLVGRLSKRFGEARLIVFGTLTSFVALGFLPYAGSLRLVMVWLALLALGQGLTTPSLSALTSKLVDADEVGGVMGVYQSVSSLGRILGPFWAEIAYLGIGHEWPYRTGSLFMLFAGIAGIVMLSKLRSITFLRPTKIMPRQRL